jgi:hypothetical protein
MDGSPLAIISIFSWVPLARRIRHLMKTGELVGSRTARERVTIEIAATNISTADISASVCLRA